MARPGREEIVRQFYAESQPGPCSCFSVTAKGGRGNLPPVVHPYPHCLPRVPHSQEPEDLEWRLRGWRCGGTEMRTRTFDDGRWVAARQGADVQNLHGVDSRRTTAMRATVQPFLAPLRVLCVGVLGGSELTPIENTIKWACACFDAPITNLARGQHHKEYTS